MLHLEVLWNYLKIFPAFLRLSRQGLERGTIFYHDLSSLNQQGVLREDFLAELCAGKRVLHLGFVDAPFSEERTRKKLLLHQRLQERAQLVYGLDVDQKSVELYRQLTGDTQNMVFDLLKPQANLDPLAQRFDVVLFGEVLEHLLNPAAALANLREICLRNPGAKLCVTVPNAFSLLEFAVAIGGDELVHPDHYFYFSPVTLKKLLTDTGFKHVEIRLYAHARLRGSAGITKHGLIALCQAA